MENSIFNARNSNIEGRLRKGRGTVMENRSLIKDTFIKGTSKVDS
jgi:hypothetical protein